MLSIFPVDVTDLLCVNLLLVCSIFPVFRYGKQLIKGSKVGDVVNFLKINNICKVKLSASMCVFM